MEKYYIDYVDSYWIVFLEVGYSYKRKIGKFQNKSEAFEYLNSFL